MNTHSSKFDRNKLIKKTVDAIEHQRQVVATEVSEYCARTELELLRTTIPPAVDVADQVERLLQFSVILSRLGLTQQARNRWSRGSTQFLPLTHKIVECVLSGDLEAAQECAAGLTDKYHMREVGCELGRGAVEFFYRELHLQRDLQKCAIRTAGDENNARSAQPVWESLAKEEKLALVKTTGALVGVDNKRKLATAIHARLHPDSKVKSESIRTFINREGITTW